MGKEKRALRKSIKGDVKNRGFLFRLEVAPRLTVSAKSWGVVGKIQQR